MAETNPEGQQVISRVEDNNKEGEEEREEDIESDDSSEEGSDNEGVEVRLGFVEEPEEPELLSLNEGFPNKVGGKPVWLDVEHLPPSSELICKKCDKQMIFLLQIYAPIEGNPSAFHRTVFVFCCKNGSCKSYKVFRAQLPRENSIYTNEAHEDDVELKDESNFKFAPVCGVCGCLAPKRCGHCHRATYCSREHQVEDWRIGHAEICKKIQAWKLERGLDKAVDIPKSVELPKFNKYPSHFLFKEMEVITDVEPGADLEKALPEGEKKGILDKYNDYLKNWTNKDNTELNDEFKSGYSDKCFGKFYKRISRDPEQILRYCRSEDSQPLWVSVKGQAPQADIPHCQLCGGERKFEFQILPQLLHYLGVEKQSKEKEIAALDWGTLAVYTCWNSCSLTKDKDKDKDKGWAEEYLWAQDIQ